MDSKKIRKRADEMKSSGENRRYNALMDQLNQMRKGASLEEMLSPYSGQGQVPTQPIQRSMPGSEQEFSNLPPEIVNALLLSQGQPQSFQREPEQGPPDMEELARYFMWRKLLQQYGVLPEQGLQNAMYQPNMIIPQDELGILGP